MRFRYHTFEYGGFDVHLRTLRDTQEFEDDAHTAENLGISTAMWPYFGVVWDAGHALAHLAAEIDVDGLRVLEVGCGIAVASVVLNKRGANITATDRHPQAGPFLAYNTELNDDPSIPFVRTSWADDGDALGTFDLILGAALLYDRDQVKPLADHLAKHAKPACTILTVGERRGLDSTLRKHLEPYGFVPFDVELSENTDPTFVGGAHGFRRG